MLVVGIERDECKNLVELAKQQEAQDTSGEYMYRVRGRPGNMNIKKYASGSK